MANHCLNNTGYVNVIVSDKQKHLLIDRVPVLRVAAAHAKEALRNMQIECQNYAYEHGIDKPDQDQWTWPG